MTYVFIIVKLFQLSVDLYAFIDFINTKGIFKTYFSYFFSSDVSFKQTFQQNTSKSSFLY